MAITRVDATSNGANTATSMSLNVPSGIQDDDLILFFGSCDGVGWGLPSGFTELYDYDIAGTNDRVMVAYRKASSEPASYTITVADAVTAERGVGFFVAYRGVHLTLPIENSTSLYNSTATATPSFTALTPSHDDCGVVAFLGHERGQNSAAFLSSWPTGLTEVMDNDVGGPPGTGNASASGGFAEDIQTTATEITGTVTCAGTAGRSGAFLISLRPDTYDIITAADAESATEVTKPALVIVDALTAADVESVSSVSIPVGKNVHPLTAKSVTAFSMVGRSTAYSLDGLDAEGNIDTLVSSLDDPVWIGPVLAEVAGVDVLLADDAESATEVTKPALVHVVAALADDVESASEVTSPALVHVVAVLADDVESASQVSTPALTAVGDTATFTSVDARRGHGTGWAKKTLSQLDREKKKEIARLRKLARKRLKAEIDRQPKRDLDSLLAIAEERIERAVPEGAEWLDPQLIEMTAILVMQGLEEYRADQQALSDENDRAILLLAA